MAMTLIPFLAHAKQCHIADTVNPARGLHGMAVLKLQAGVVDDKADSTGWPVALQ